MKLQIAKCKLPIWNLHFAFCNLQCLALLTRIPVHQSLLLNPEGSVAIGASFIVVIGTVFTRTVQATGSGEDP